MSSDIERLERDKHHIAIFPWEILAASKSIHWYQLLLWIDDFIFVESSVGKIIASLTYASKNGYIFIKKGNKR